MRYSKALTHSLCALALGLAVVSAACGDDRTGTLVPSDTGEGAPSLDIEAPADAADASDDLADGDDIAVVPDGDGPDLSDATVPPDTADAGDSADAADAEDAEDAEDTEVGVDTGIDPTRWAFNYRGTRVPVGRGCDEDADCSGARNVCDPLHKVCVECVVETDCGRHHICNVGTCVDRPFGPYCVSNYDCNDPDRPVCRSLEHKGLHPRTYITEETAYAMEYPDSPRSFPYVWFTNRPDLWLSSASVWYCAPDQTSCPAGEFPFPTGCKKACALDIDCPVGLVCHGLEPLAEDIYDRWSDQSYLGYCGLPSCLGRFDRVVPGDIHSPWHEVEPPERRCPPGTYCAAGNDCLAWPVHRVPNALEPLYFPTGLLDECRTDADCGSPDLRCDRYNLEDGTLMAGCVECAVDAHCEGKGGVCDRTLGLCGACRPANSLQAEAGCPSDYECTSTRECRPRLCRTPGGVDEGTCPAVYHSSYPKVLRLRDDLTVEKLRESWVPTVSGSILPLFCGPSDIQASTTGAAFWSRMDQRCMCSPHPDDPKLELCTLRDDDPNDL